MLDLGGEVKEGASHWVPMTGHVGIAQAALRLSRSVLDTKKYFLR